MVGSCVIGTAGHIDHGKTSLVFALTGTDTDRLKEEKERGITIELGFAHARLPSLQTVSFVDVPGHERFVKTMVAGAQGFDAVLLIVAADEGVMPQTLEHLDICELLGIQTGVCVLTKSDLVAPDGLALAQDDVKRVLSRTFLRDAPILPFSAQTKEGLPELVAALERTVSSVRTRDTEAEVRLPMDRVFTTKGFGTIVTGTLWSGTLRVGEELVSLPSGKQTAKIRGIQCHGKGVETASAGQRVAVNLSIPHTSLVRGEMLVRPDGLRASSVFFSSLRLLPSADEKLPRRSRLLLHLGCERRLVNLLLLDRDELLPGETALAQCSLSEPLCVMPGDPFVLRGFHKQKNHGTTVGGGLVLSNLAVPVRRKTAGLLDWLSQVGKSFPILPDARETACMSLLRLHAEKQGVSGTGLTHLIRSLPFAKRVLLGALATCVREGQLVRLPSLPQEEEGAFLSHAAFRQLREGVLSVLSEHHRTQPHSAGFPKDLLHKQLGSACKGVSERVLDAVCERLREEGAIASERELLRLSTFAQKPALSKDSQAILSVLQRAGLAAPRDTELATLLQEERRTKTPWSDKELKPLLSALIRAGEIIRVQEFLFHKTVVDDLRTRLLDHLRVHREIDPTTWKTLVGQSRKYCIPLAEHFDNERLTLRVGDARRLR